MTHHELTIRVPTAKVSDDLATILDGAHDIREIRSTLLHFYGGYETTYGFGGWRNADGRDIKEPMTIWMCLTDDPEGWRKLRQYARWLRWKLGEDCVLIRKAVVDAEFVEADEE